jgi:hypothetical protein
MSHDVLVPPDGWHLMAAARMPAPAPSARGLLFRTVAQFSSRLGRKHPTHQMEREISSFMISLVPP